MTDSPHLDPEQAAQYAANLLDAAERARLDEHIDVCAECRELLSAIARAAVTTIEARLSAQPTASHQVLLPRGTKVGPYELLQPLGAGGMGLVYEAFDARLSRRVALKCVREPKGGARAQLQREAQLMAQLAHPNVVSVYDLLDAHEQLFMAMELVPGTSLREWLEAEHRPWQRVVDVFLEAGAGLAAAHDAGIIHGDIKPANVLLGQDGRPRVTDFGLASVGADDSGTIRGTRAYMSPEQTEGAPCDARSDQYAFGVSLYEGLFGALPGQRGRGRPPESVPRSVRRVLERALARKPADRFPSMQALLVELRRARLARWRYVVAVVAAALVFVVFSFGLGGRQATRAQCDAAASELASPWTPETKAAAKAAFARLQLSYGDATFARVEKTLDTWSREYETSKGVACASSWFSREAEPGLPRQLACLRQASLDARALVTQLLDADVALTLRAVQAVQALPSLERCTHQENDFLAVPASGEKAREVNERIAKTRALAAAGRYQAALPAAEEALAAAKALGDPALLATTVTLVGGAQGLVGRHEEAARTLREAIRLSEQAHEDRARAFAWSDLLAVSYNLGRPDEVLALGPIARGACERINDVRLLTDVLATIGSSLSDKGRADEARALLEEAVRLRVEAYGPRDRRTSATLSVLANVKAMSGDLAGAIDGHTRALDAAKEAFGPEHPETGIIEFNLGDDFLYGLQLEPARVAFTGALATLSAANGPRTRDANFARTDLGFTLLLMGRHEEARATFEEAASVWAEIAPKHPTHAMALLGLHQADVALGRPPRVADLERAVTLAGDLPPFDKGRVEFALAQVVADPARAKALHASALEGLSSAPLPLILEVKTLAEAWAPAK